MWKEDSLCHSCQRSMICPKELFSNSHNKNDPCLILMVGHRLVCILRTVDETIQDGKCANQLCAAASRREEGVTDSPSYHVAMRCDAMRCTQRLTDDPRNIACELHASIHVWCQPLSLSVVQTLWSSLLLVYVTEWLFFRCKQPRRWLAKYAATHD